jgi:tetratricopeptide (TPR) repeat protein
MRDQQVLLLGLFFCVVGGVLCLGYGQSLTFAQVSGRVTEEDLPPEDTHAPTETNDSLPFSFPGAQEATVPVPLPSFPARETPIALPNPPVLPAPTALSPQELIALRFVESGKGLLEAGDTESAREQFERALTLAPFQPYGYYFLGRLAFTRGDSKQALAFLRKAELAFAPGEYAWLGETTGLQGAIYEELGAYDHARAAYQHCLQLTPTNLKALSALARLSEEEPLPSDSVLP